MTNLLMSLSVQEVFARSRQIYTVSQIEDALNLQAEQINCYYGDDRYLALVLLNGGIVYSGMLLPKLSGELHLGSIKVSRYRRETSGGELHWEYRPSESLRGKKILLLDDIFDQGVTIDLVKRYCLDAGALDVKSAVLALKQIPEKNQVGCPDFFALTVPDVFVYGMGMDCGHRFRNAPGIFEVPESFLK